MNLYNVKFVRAIDGDTLVFNIPNVPEIFGRNLSIRLKRIQCKEIRSKDKADFHEAMKAKQFSQGRCEKGGIIVLANLERGKYFRLLADVFVNGVLLNAELLDKGLAVKSHY